MVFHQESLVELAVTKLQKFIYAGTIFQDNDLEKNILVNN